MKKYIGYELSTRRPTSYTTHGGNIWSALAGGMTTGTASLSWLMILIVSMTLLCVGIMLAQLLPHE
jgi:hypothetical protein